MHTDEKILIICSVCGSDHVSRDAWADWDVQSQEWILGAVFDQGFCHRCEEEQKLDERAVGEGNLLTFAER